MSEAELVKSWRERGFSWQAIAHNMRRNVDDVRRDHERGYTPLFTKPERPDRFETRFHGRPCSAIRKTVIVTLLRETQPISGDVIGDSSAVSNVIRDLRRKYGADAITNNRSAGYLLSASGRKAMFKDYGAWL